MKSKPISSPMRTAVIYLIFGATWILTSDTILGLLIPHTSDAYPLAQTIKGWLFVLAGAVLLYMILMVDANAIQKHETERKQSQDLYQKLFDSNPQPMWVFDTETLHFLMVNNAAIRHYGYSREEFLNMSIKDIRPAAEIPMLIADLAQSPEMLQKSSGWTHHKKDGTLIDVEISSHLIDFKGRPARMVLANDITERKQMERALQNSEAQFRTLVEQLPAITYIASPDETSSTLYVSPPVEKILGIPPTEYIAIPDMWYQQLHPDDRERVLNELQESQQNSKPFNSEYRMITKEGSVVWVSDSANIVRDNSGNALFLEGFMLDITERKQAEEALRISEENYRNLAETSDSAIAVLNLNGQILYANPTCIRIWNDPHLVGKSVYDLFTKEVADRYLAIMQRVIKEHIIDLNELETHINGKAMWFQVSMSPLKSSDGTVNTLLLNAFDLTERKRAEEAQRQSEILFFKVFRSSPIGINIFRLSDGHSYNVNDTFLEIIGYAREEVIGHSAEDLNLFIDAEERNPWNEQLHSGRRIINQDAKIRRKSGEIRDCLAAFDIIEINDIPMVLVIVTDITDRKRTEDQLRRNEERYRSTLDSMLEGIQIINFEWQYAYVNDAVARQGQNTPENLLGHSMMEMYPGIEHTELFAILRDCMENRKVKRFENHFTFPDGTSGWFELNVQPAPEGLFILSIDITERKKAEEKLRSSEERFRLMAENIEEGFWITDPSSGGEIYLSPAIERIFWRNTEEFMEKPTAFIDSILPEDVPHVLTNMERQKVGEATNMEYRIRIPDGSVRWIWDRAFPVLEKDGNVKFVTGLTTDITERKETDARLQTQLKRLSALNSIDRAISSSLGLQVSLDVLLIEVMAQLGVDSASILLLNDATLTLEYVAGKGFRSHSIQYSSLPFGKGLAGRVGAERKALHIPNLSEIGEEFLRADLLKDEDFLEYYGVPLIAKGQLKGVLEIFNREALNPDPEWLDYLETLGRQAAIAIENAQLFEGLQKSNQELFMAYDATIAGWSHAMDLRDKETEGHTQRVSELTLKLAERMGISQQEQVHIRRGALLHDIGKLGVPDQILLKPGKLTEEEWVIMRKHPTYALEMLMPIYYLRPALDIPYCHHEKWDGTGYPRGLKGEEIPLAARIFAVVDVWDALRSDRPYRDGWSPEKTRDYILAESGKHFEPKVVEIFMELLEELPNL